MINVKTGQLTSGGQFEAYKRGQLERNIHTGYITNPDSDVYSLLLDMIEIDIIIESYGFIIDTKSPNYGKIYLRFNSVGLLQTYKNDDMNHYLIIQLSHSFIHYRYNKNTKNFEYIKDKIQELERVILKAE